MNSYTAGLNGKQIEIQAKDLWSAKQLAVQILKPKKKDIGMVWVVLNTTHDAAMLD